jgi:hypothetical protein
MTRIGISHWRAEPRFVKLSKIEQEAFATRIGNQRDTRIESASPGIARRSPRLSRLLADTYTLYLKTTTSTGT